MTAEEMSSLQQQYEPMHASPLKATTVVQEVSDKMTAVDETTRTGVETTTEISLPSSTATTELDVPTKTEQTTSSTKCLSFRNQISLVLSTEDNIDNSLLKKQIFPTKDCNNSEAQVTNPLAKIQHIDSTVTEPATTSRAITLTTTRRESVTPSQYTSQQLPVYRSSSLSNHPSRPDVAVVTSLPVLIDLKSSRNRLVTDVPAWREVTVGVVRDQQGQPLKPRYNNWSAHLRGLRKRNDNKFWTDFTTPIPSFKEQQRTPLQHNFQPAPSHINRSFWTDLQRQRTTSDQQLRNKGSFSSQPYLTNPPKNYLAANAANDYQFWRNREISNNNNNNNNNNLRQNASNRWHSQSNVPVLHPQSNTPVLYPQSTSGRMSGPLRNPKRTFESQESRHHQLLNPSSLRQNNRRW